MPPPEAGQPEQSRRPPAEPQAATRLKQWNSPQVFLFWGAGLIALTLIYTLVVFFPFKGKTAVEPLA